MVIERLNNIGYHAFTYTFVICPLLSCVAMVTVFVEIASL